MVARLVGAVWVVRKARSGPEGPFITAGRSTDNDLVIPEYSVSQLHCSFRLEVKRWKPGRPYRLFATDRESLNGTAVRGARIPSGEEVELNPGDELAMGRLQFTVLDAMGFLHRVAEATGLELPK